MDPVGYTCTDPTATQQIADMLRTNVSSWISCDGHWWMLCNWTSYSELWIDPPSVCDYANCPSPGWLVRPCFGYCSYSGLNSNTCGGPNQTINLEFD
jgi:hypothetical protein